jgi:hypothetical protein
MMQSGTINIVSRMKGARCRRYPRGSGVDDVDPRTVLHELEVAATIDGELGEHRDAQRADQQRGEQRHCLDQRLFRARDDHDEERADEREEHRAGDAPVVQEVLHVCSPLLLVRP